MLPVTSDPQADYGLPKANRDNRGPVDPRKEVDYTEYERAMVDVAAMTHTAARAMVKVICGGGAAAASLVRSCWGDTIAVTPSIVYNAAGDTTLTWTVGGYPDLNPTPARQVTRPPAFVAAKCEPQGPGFHKLTLTANTLRVQTWDQTYAANDQDYVVWVY